MGCEPTGLGLMGGRLSIYNDCDICPFRLRNVPHQQDTNSIKGIGVPPDLQSTDIKGTVTPMQQVHHSRGHKGQIHSQRKDRCAASQETKRVSWSSHLNLNVNVLFKFILL